MENIFLEEIKGVEGQRKPARDKGKQCPVAFRSVSTYIWTFWIRTYHLINSNAILIVLAAWPLQNARTSAPLPLPPRLL